MKLVAVTFALVSSFVGCKKADENKPAPAATLTTGTVDSQGVRAVPIEVVTEGYRPDRIPGKPGEKLKLVFTRRVDGECFEVLKTPDGKTVNLPKDKPFEVAVTVPMDGEVKFACGMDMLQGVIVAEKPKG